MRPTDQIDSGPAHAFQELASLLATGFLRMKRRAALPSEDSPIRLEAAREFSLNDHAGLRRDEETKA
jgi:hypothetical protein